MSIPPQWLGALRLPVIAAPMFLASGPNLVVAACGSGVVGTFPALNQRTTEGYEEWLEEIAARLADESRPAVPFGVNLIVHSSNPRLEADFAATVAHRVPLVITSLGSAARIVDRVHAYGGLVFHDAVNMRHAAKAAAAGVDGIIAVAAGAGGHGGTLSPFALISEIRQIFAGTIVLSGAIGRGEHILAAQAAGADLAYMGTRFLATTESTAPEAHKEMTTASNAADILYTDKFSVAPANYLRPSIVDSGLDPAHLPETVPHAVGSAVRPWKNIWSAGQGVGPVGSVETVARLCERLEVEYGAAMESLRRSQRKEADADRAR